jgi:hypothetical protein
VDKFLSVTKDQLDDMIFHLHIKNYKGYCGGELFFATVHHDCLISLIHQEYIEELTNLKCGETWRLSLQFYSIFKG